MSTPKPISVRESGIHLVERSDGERLHRGPLELWHLLSLDAPTVAVTWTIFVAWSAGIPLGVADPLAIFVAVWILYATDRLLDARQLGTDTTHADAELEARHLFHHENRQRFLPALALATLPLALLLHRMQDRVLHDFVILAALLSGWLVLVHIGPASNARRLPKELAVGVFFPVAVFIPTLAGSPTLLRGLLPNVLLLAVLCFLNCVFLYRWEHPHDLKAAAPSTRIAARHLTAMPLGLIFLCVIALLTPGAGASMGAGRTHGIAVAAHPYFVPAAVLLSSVLLLVLHKLRTRISPLRLRALADLVLLTPGLIALLANVTSRQR